MGGRSIGGVGVGGRAADPSADQAGRRFGGAADGEYSVSQWRLGRDQGGLLDNPALDWRDLLEVHTVRTGERLQGHPVVLCLQDTTEADFTSQPGIAGLGRLSYEAQHGLYVHPPWW